MNKYYNYILRIQSALIICVIYYGVINLTPGSINENLREKVLDKNAQGYMFYKWANYQLLGRSEPILTFNRSISFSKNYPISRDHLFFVNLSKNDAKDYVDEIKQINPKYLVYSTIGKTFKKYENCTTKLIKTEKNIDYNAVRNPVSKSNQKFDMFLYEIDTKLIPECINPNKVDPFVRH